MNKIKKYLKENIGKILLLLVIIVMIFFKMKDSGEFLKRDNVPTIAKKIE